MLQDNSRIIKKTAGYQATYTSQYDYRMQFQSALMNNTYIFIKLMDPTCSVSSMPTREFITKKPIYPFLGKLIISPHFPFCLKNIAHFQPFLGK